MLQKQQQQQQQQQHRLAVVTNKSVPYASAFFTTEIWYQKKASVS